MHALARLQACTIILEAETATGHRPSLGVHPSPFGLAVVVAAGEGLAGLAFVDDASEIDAPVEAMLRRWKLTGMAADFDLTGALLESALAANRVKPLPLVLIGTAFERTVWRALLAIPFGGTVSYGDIARFIGAPKAARAVGGAIARNNIAFAVPCHRVLGRDGAPIGFRWGLARKYDMLQWEAARRADAGLQAA